MGLQKKNGRKSFWPEEYQRIRISHADGVSQDLVQPILMQDFEWKINCSRQDPQQHLRIRCRRGDPKSCTQQELLRTSHELDVSTWVGNSKIDVNRKLAIIHNEHTGVSGYRFPIMKSNHKTSTGTRIGLSCSTAESEVTFVFNHKATKKTTEKFPGERMVAS